MLAAFVGQVCGLVLAFCIPSVVCQNVLYRRPDVLYIYRRPDVLYRRPDVLYRRPDVLYRRPGVLYRRPDVLYTEGLVCYIEAELGAENSPTVVLKDTSLMSIGPEP